jgi:hypothetical protein
VKNARKVHTLSGAYLHRLLMYALKLGKDAKCIVVFEDAGVTAEITLRLTGRKH